MCDNTEFSNLKNTWTRKTSLNMTGWDPYPELQGPDCFGNRCFDQKMNEASKESYCCAGINPWLASTYNRSDIGPHANTIQTVMLQKEGFDLPCCFTDGYQNLRNTWKDQKRYSL